MEAQTLAALLGAGAAGAALVVDDRRRRGIAMLAALVLAGVALALLAEDQIADVVLPGPALVAFGAVGALALLAGPAILFRVYPAALPLALVAALPFRV